MFTTKLELKMLPHNFLDKLEMTTRSHFELVEKVRLIMLRINLYKA